MSLTETMEPGATPALSLADLYREIWRQPQYRAWSPGEDCIDLALVALKPEPGASFIDFGCGTGRAARALKERGFAVTGVDFADNCLDDGLDVPLVVADLTQPLAISAEYGYCTDVLEHLGPDSVDEALITIGQAVTKGIFLTIALVADEFGPILAGKPLHLTVRDAEWWKRKLNAAWPRVEVIEETHTQLLAACFTWPPRFRPEVLVSAFPNTPREVLLANVAQNSRRDEPWLASQPAHDGHAVMVGGGPSLTSTLAEIAFRAQHGQTIFALNNAANFLKENGIVPDYQLVMDGRPENVRLVQPRAARRYLIGSQVHPSLLDALYGEDVTLFHHGTEGIMDVIPKRGRRLCMLGGEYVLGPVALTAAHALGYRMMHLYGYDSSDAPDGSSHAYAQPQTEAELKRLEMKVGDRIFRTNFAMYKQAEQFPNIAQMLADHGCTLTIHGDGLLQAIAREMTRPCG